MVLIDSIKSVLEKHFHVYNFVSTETYKHERTKLHKNDAFTDYSFLEDYKTIIVVAIPYPSKTVPWEKKGYGILSRSSYGIDYHKVVHKLLEETVNDLKGLGIRAKASVDVSGIDERFAGYVSSLGWLGKNQYLIIDGYGTYTFLATILIDKELPTILKVHSGCGDCTKCIDACPTGALDNGFDRSKCISHLSQEKMAFNEEQISYFKNMIYGCDICQLACPKNTGIDIHFYEEFEPTGIENIHIKDLLNWSNKEYMSIYRNNASSWKGATIIKRNALALIANQKNTDLIPDIKESMVKLSSNSWYNKTAQLVLKLLERT